MSANNSRAAVADAAQSQATTAEGRMDRIDAFWNAGAQRWRPVLDAPTPPHRDRDAIIAWVQDVCRRIDAEFGPALLKGRFDHFRSVEQSGVMPAFLLDSYPIEYGMFLCIEHPWLVPRVPPGYLAWADAFCNLYIELRRELSSQRWKLIVKDDLKSGLGKHGWGEFRSLADVFFQMRFWNIFSQLAPMEPGFSLVPGPEQPVPKGEKRAKADFVLRGPGQRLYSVECKVLRNGPVRSRWDHFLSEALHRSAAIRRFLAEGSGVAHIVVPKLEFLGEPDGPARLAADIDDVIAGRAGQHRIVLDGGIRETPDFAPEAVRSFTRAAAPPDHTLVRVVGFDLDTGIERGASFVCYWPVDHGVFARNVTERVRKILDEQALKRRPAIMAANVDFLTILQAHGDALDAPGTPAASHAAGVVGSMEAIKAAVAADPVCQNLYGVLLCADDPIHSAATWDPRVGTALAFWRNPASPFRDDVVLPFDRLDRIR